MNQSKHSKYKNSGIIFELLIRQVASDILSNNDSPAVGIIKKYFNKTELAKEYKLYQTIVNSKQLNESKADILVNTVLDLSLKINRGNLKKEKYNLIKEIKENYDIEEFFKNKIKNYKEYAAIYNLMESKHSNNFINPQLVIQNKLTILEHITQKSTDQVKDQVIQEFLEMDKGSRIIAYKVLLEKFNRKYSSLSNPQKSILKEYINNISNTVKLNEYVNNQYDSIRKTLYRLNKDIDDTTTKIKINEIINLIKPIGKNQNVKDEDLINLLHFHELIQEINAVMDEK